MLKELNTSLQHPSRGTDFAISLSIQTDPFLFIPFRHKQKRADASDFKLEVWFKPYMLFNTHISHRPAEAFNTVWKESKF